MTEAEAFIHDIKMVYARHGLALSHEDQHGNFIIVRAETIGDQHKYGKLLEEAIDESGEAS